MPDDSVKQPPAPAHFASTAAAIPDELEAAQHAGRYPIGARLGDYLVEGFIAEGGFGSVYRALHPRFGPVALKISHLPTGKLSTERLALQQDELEALHKLRHPSLVRVLDHGALPNLNDPKDQKTYLALELIEGESLHHHMVRRGRIDVIEAISLMRRLAEGIAHCHEHRILHLDLTPRNVIVVDPLAPDVRIVDFGVAAFVENRLDNQRRPAAGTPLYMAPEMVSDQGQIGPHCDVYALGIIFYELLTGRLPFGSTGTWDLFLEKLRGDVPKVTTHAPEVPEQVADTVHALLHPDPAQRGYSAASLGAHLKDLYFDVLRGTSAAPQTRAGRPSGAGLAPIEVDAHAIPLVGRDDELRDLVTKAQASLYARGPSVSGTGWAVALTGDPGIGKSRLLAEVTHHLQLTRVASGYGRCREHGNLVSYAIWRECLGQLHRAVAKAAAPHGEPARKALKELLADPAVADLASLVPDLRAARDGTETEPAAAPALDVGTKRVSQAVKRLVTTIAAHIPTVLVLEDLHWADQGTLDILGALVAAPLPAGLVILCTSRPEPPLPSWPALDVVPVAPLDESRSAALLRALAGGAGESVIDDLTATIPLLRMGNPLVDTQVILHLKREGLLTTDGQGRVTLAERFDRDYEPPTSVSSVLERRLRHVSPRAREILGVASLIGRQFRLSDLHEITGGSIDDVAREAIELTLCRAQGDEWVFVHDVIRDHLVSTVDTARRPALHARIAKTLAERGAPAATLAYHLDEAGDRPAAAARYVQGGIEADRVHDLIGSSKNLRRAAAIYLELPPSPERDRQLAHATHELARITCLLGKTHEPLEDLDRARLAMSEHPPADAQVMIDSAYARVYYAQGVFDRAMAHSERCLAVDDKALGAYQCVPANMLGRALCASGHFGPSIDVLQRGCQLLRDAGDRVELAHSLGLMGTSLAFVGDFAASQRAIDESQELAEALDNPARRMGVCLYQTLNAEAAAKWDQGIQTSAHLLAQAEEYSMAGLYLYLGTMMAGRHHFHIGELHRARHLLKNAINFSNLFGIRTCRSWGYAYLGDVYFVEGDLEEAMRWYTSAHELAREGKGDGFGVPLALIGLAHGSARIGAPPARVRELAEEAFRAFDAASNVTGLALGLVRYLDALDVLGAPDDLRDPPRRRLDALTGVPHGDFWPVPPASASQDPSIPPADFWRARAASGSGTFPATDSGELPATGTSLLLRLSTIADYVPDYVPKHVP